MWHQVPLQPPPQKMSFSACIRRGNTRLNTILHFRPKRLQNLSHISVSLQVPNIRRKYSGMNPLQYLKNGRKCPHLTHFLNPANESKKKTYIVVSVSCCPHALARRTQYRQVLQCNYPVQEPSRDLSDPFGYSHLNPFLHIICWILNSLGGM